MAPRQSKIQLVFFLVLIGLIIFVKVGLKEVGHVAAEWVAETPHPDSGPEVPVDSGPGLPREALPARLLGEGTMEHYGDPSRPPEEDLMWLARTLDNFALLVKGTQPLLAGANEEIAARLQGNNPVHLEFLPKTHRAFNEKGQIVDRWGTPVFFHANAADRIDIRSAGPDREMWTADDLHRRYDGRFLKGEALLAPSLFEETSKVR